MQGQVLLASGRYKDISLVNPGDCVLNTSLKPVRVIERIKVPSQEVIELQHLNWYKPTLLTPETRVITAQDVDGESLVEWRAAEEATSKEFLTSDESLYYSILSPDFTIPLSTNLGISTLRPTRELGLIFGWYAGYGAISEQKVLFRFGNNDVLTNYVVETLRQVFGVTAHVDKNEHIHQITLDEEFLLDLFGLFGSRLEREIPRQFWCCHTDYNQGIFEGLVDFDPETKVARYIPLSARMAEYFVCCCSLLGLSFMSPNRDVNVYPLFVVDQQEDSILGQITATRRIASPGEMWNLRIDCPTQSFIADNMVVHGL